jgi:hypothetical protein
MRCGINSCHSKQLFLEPGTCWLEVVHSHACHPNNHSVPCGALKLPDTGGLHMAGEVSTHRHRKSHFNSILPTPKNENRNKNHKVANVTGLGYVCQQKFEFMYVITLFRPIIMFSETDIILRNIPLIQPKCEEYSIETINPTEHCYGFE